VESQGTKSGIRGRGEMPIGDFGVPPVMAWIALARDDPDPRFGRVPR
jgi:hypothetical protein